MSCGQEGRANEGEGVSRRGKRPCGCRKGMVGPGILGSEVTVDRLKQILRGVQSLMWRVRVGKMGTGEYSKRWLSVRSRVTQD